MKPQAGGKTVAGTELAKEDLRRCVCVVCVRACVCDAAVISTRRGEQSRSKKFEIVEVCTGEFSKTISEPPFSAPPSRSIPAS